MSIPSRRTLRIPSPWGEVGLCRGRRGAARIHGPNPDARAFGLGWAHGHDRPLQMTVLRIAARGRAAELLQGTPGLVAQDRYLRQRGLVAGARAEVGSLDTPTADRLAAYCGGVNAAFARPGQPLALTALGLREEPWEREDVLLLLRLFAYLSLSQNQEITERFLVSAWLGGRDDAALAAIHRPGLEGFDPSWLRGPSPVAIEPPAVPLDPLCAGAMPQWSASNAFAVAGHRSATGHALLANDPHLEVQSLPPTFYEVALGGPDGHAVGVSVPGLPGLLAGRFHRVAVGVTYGFLDQVDFFVEDCRDGRVRRGDRWVPAQRIDEEIRVRGGEPETLTIWRTDRGVLEGDPRNGGRLLCRAWSADVAGLAGALAVHDRLLHAADLDEAFEATAAMPLSINYVLADAGGRIGLQQAGLAPHRAPGHTGLSPLPAWDPATRWRGVLPPSALHREDATARGWIATTNDAVNPPGRVLVNAAAAGYRRDRLDQLLAGPRRLGPEHLVAMQGDMTSLRAQRLMAAIRPHLPATDRGRLLAAWTGRFGEEEAGATLFERVRAAWTRAAFGALFERARIACEPPDPRATIGLDPASDGDRLWLESNPHVVHGRGWDDALLDPAHPIWAGRDAGAVLRAAVEAGLSRPPVPWRRAQRFLRSWLLLDGSAVARLGAAARMQALPGSPETIRQGRLLRSGGRLLAYGPVWRMVADLGAPGLRCMLNGGPTDQPGRPHYRAGLGPFARLELEQLEPPTG